ncbi:CaiB/BaiF CoA-transferase family protein [Agriterribacter sp.]|uniref:CaiB/BaiF CoA transferase family protein n=1 Tax=Agriterribacter sp. TaxID=2821509 RepID=UPI002BF5BF6E|nr:CaiB/BaiF CoA-transferase family protein [Agriterribacter sp.]HTN08830.1 CaiB/BaiF CoA-transferase family protein [Agriterribacter sp.]
MHLPLKGIVVLEFSQYLSGPCAGLRLADLGAQVIKIERPQKGEAGRKLAIKNLWADESSLLFHTINRNKESFTADLDDPQDMQWIKRLIGQADVITHNFRPGVMKKKGLHYEAVKEINPGIIYTEISGYGNDGPWKNKPGQDLLIQSLSGLTHSTGNYDDNPLPFGLGIADYLCGNQAVQFILGALIRKKRTGKGAFLQLSLMEALIDFQFEFFTTYFQSKRQHKRSAVSNGHSLLSAPYGIYKTRDGYIAIAMMPLQKLNAAIACAALNVFEEKEAFEKRDEIKAIISAHLLTATTASWLKKTQPLDLWVMPVLNWRQLKETDGYKVLQMEQQVQLNDKEITTTRCPVRINGQLFLSAKPAPAVGQHTENIKATLSLKL